MVNFRNIKELKYNPFNFTQMSNEDLIYAK